jgi:hypothetical protein
MIYNLKNPYEREQFQSWCAMMLDRQNVVECVNKQKRTLKQNAYLHVLLGFFASEWGNTLEEVKQDIFKRQCNPKLFCIVKRNKFGKMVTTLRSTSSLTTGEMTTAIERFRNWSVSECGLYLPGPNENEFLLYCQQQIERNREFLTEGGGDD